MPTAEPIIEYSSDNVTQRLRSYADIDELDKVIIRAFKDRIAYDENLCFFYCQDLETVKPELKIVPVDFFAKSLSTLKNVQLPSIVIKPSTSPAESQLITSRVITQDQYHLENDESVRVEKPPVWFDVDYEIIVNSNQWKMNRGLSFLVENGVFPVKNGQRFLTIDGINRGVSITSQNSEDTPDKRLFRTFLTIRLTLPIKVFPDVFSLRTFTIALGLTSDQGLSESNNLTYNLPSAPTSLTAAEHSINSLKVDWTDNSDNETGFEIERKFGKGVFKIAGRTGVDVNSFIDTGLFDGTTYTYRCRAFNKTGYSDYSNEFELTL